MRREYEVTKLWGPKTAADECPSGGARQLRKRLVGVVPVERWLSRWSGWSLDGWLGVQRGSRIGKPRERNYANQ